MSWLKKIFGRTTSNASAKNPSDTAPYSPNNAIDVSPFSAEKAYRIFSPRSSQEIARWAKEFPEFREIVGYSFLGHFFLRNPDSQEYIVLHPFKGAAKSYGVHASVEDFEKNVLNEPGFSLYVLRPDHVAEIHLLLGELEEDEIYIPEPYPFLGGTQAPETYSKGNVWIFMDIVGQMGGLED